MLSLSVRVDQLVVILRESLGALVIKESVRRAGLNNDDIDELIMGSVLPHGLGQNPARHHFASVAGRR